ncbi:cache domain-containing sensor histidine kinase [Paenibacillus roseipurpureus]|uniref:Sensor histidine kinase n=1 Tax=Paenibacillus roseopurpureus TaxID=2918901 RepID=A0AA96LN72_9BACL|nr:sensor histidine kinase [Paenibacillus sp. MBLB1832]WNR44138.1 sensor histidine kinase [Paenibacillus sp. MBLB1832]
MLNWFRTLSLRNKFVLTILICLVLPSIVSMNVSNFFTRDAVRTQVTDSSRESMRIVNQIVSGQMKNMLYIMNFMQFDEDIQDPILSLSHVDDSTSIGDIFVSKNTIIKRLGTVMNTLGNMYVTLLLPNGQYVATYTTMNFDPRTFMKNSWFPEVEGISGYNVKWIGAEPNYTNGSNQPYVLSAAKKLSLNGLTKGYVIVGLEMTALQQLFNQYENNESMMIIDGRGRILVDRDNSMIGKLFPYYDQLPAENGSSFVKVDGEDYILLSSQVTPEWKLVNMTPYKAAAQQIESFRKTDFGIQMVFLILFAVVLLYVVGTLTKPIAKLVQTVVRIESGQLSERSNISGADEVGRLGYVFDRMIDRIELTLIENKREQELKRKAELAMLQAQINPHFLFNVLNSIRLKIMMKGDEENAELISSLSALLRMTINRNNAYISLHEEIGINEHYVRLLNSRHGDRVVLRVSAASDTLLVQIPRFLLQPLIENAYIHGLKSQSGEITIASRIEEDGRLQVLIKDSGVGMTEERLMELLEHLENATVAQVTEKSSSPTLSGIGINNVFERLRLIYGHRFDYEITSSPGNGTAIALRFPQQPEKEV